MHTINPDGFIGLLAEHLFSEWYGRPADLFADSEKLLALATGLVNGMFAAETWPAATHNLLGHMYSSAERDAERAALRGWAERLAESLPAVEAQETRGVK